MLNIIANGYVLPFIKKHKLAGVPLIHSGYKTHQKDLVLASCIQSLLSKNAIERVENVKSLMFYSHLTQSLGWIINQEVRTQTHSLVFSFVGYEYHLDLAHVKPTQTWLKLQDLILRLKSKHVLTAKFLMLLIWLLATMEKMVPERRLHIRPFQFHLKEHW